MSRSPLRPFPALRARAAIALLAVGLALAAAPAVAAPFAAPPSPARWVTDEAGFLSAGAREALDARLGAYQQQSGHQLLLWIGHTVGEMAVEDYTVRTFAAWRVGRKGIDDGLVLFIFTDDRKVRFEVGYGLEGTMPDLLASRIIREVVVPRIQAGDRDGAASAGMEAAIAVLEGKPYQSASSGTELSSDFAQQADPRGPPDQPSPPMPLGTKILIGLLGLAFLILLVTHPSLAIYLLINLLSGGRGGGGGGGGGGGFSGGGGRSGGGGATGSW